MERLKEQKVAAIIIAAAWFAVWAVPSYVAHQLGRPIWPTSLMSVVVGGGVFGVALLLCFDSAKTWRKEGRWHIRVFVPIFGALVLAVNFFFTGMIVARPASFKPMYLNDGRYLVVEKYGELEVLVNEDRYLDFESVVKTTIPSLVSIGYARHNSFFQAEVGDYIVRGSIQANFYFPPDKEKVWLLYTRTGGRSLTQLMKGRVVETVIKMLAKLSVEELKALRHLTIEWDIPFDDIFQGTGIKIKGEVEAMNISVRLKSPPQPRRPKLQLPPHHRKIKVSEII